MAAYALTPANVIASASATKKTGIAATTITAGQILYKDTGNGKMDLADSDLAGTEGERTVAGIALHGASLNQPITYATLDPDLTIGVTTGTVLAAGQTLCLGDGGAMVPDADVATLDYKTVLGVAISATKMNFKPAAAGVATP